MTTTAINDGDRHPLVAVTSANMKEMIPTASQLFQAFDKEKRQQQQVTSKAMKFIVPHRMWLLQHDDDDDDDDNSNQPWGSSSTGGGDVGKYEGDDSHCL